ncbi:MAG: peptidylprolyl isomerase [Bacteroidales bacterium]|jgi:FKBP-type peptidyl-prolyl cis-trans isomerase SlyD|nr:peptidylprolyl isomerase [Bacteroidales bacterium]
MQIKKDKVVTLTYDLRIDNAMGELVQSTTKEEPMTFIYGHGQLLPLFEQNIDGLKSTNTFDFKIPTSEAYGEFDPTAIMDLDINVFMHDGQIDTELLSPGNYVPLSDNDGNHYQARVMRVEENTVKMDFNHPLAGKDLHFQGEIIEVREATSDELGHGHVHGKHCNHH